MDVALEGIGPVVVDVQQRTATDPEVERLGVQRAVAGHGEAVRGIAGLLLRLDGAGELQLALDVTDGDAAVVDDEAPDRRQPRRRIRLGSVGEVPARPPLGVAKQRQSWPVDLQELYVEAPGEQREQPDLEGQPVDVGERAGAGPGRVADAHALHGGAGLPGEQVDPQVPREAHLAVYPRRGQVRDGTAEPVPVPDGGQSGAGQGQRRKSGRGPQQPATPGSRRRLSRVGPRGLHAQRVSPWRPHPVQTKLNARTRRWAPR